MTELILGLLMIYLTLSIPLGVIVALTLGFTPQEVYENTHMNMPFCWIVYILLHITFFVVYLGLDVYLLAHLGRHE